jgi:hypothetical protein
MEVPFKNDGVLPKTSRWHSLGRLCGAGQVTYAACGVRINLVRSTPQLSTAVWKINLHLPLFNPATPPITIHADGLWMFLKH